MKCPVDGEVLMVADRSGVEIDYCPKCRGVWLDRGELDKIIERAAPPEPVGYAPDHADYGYDEDRDHDNRGRRGDRGDRGGRRRENPLMELFDFF